MHEDVAHQRFYHASTRLKFGTMYVYKARLRAINASEIDYTFYHGAPVSKKVLEGSIYPIETIKIRFGSGLNFTSKMYSVR